MGVSDLTLENLYCSASLITPPPKINPYSSLSNTSDSENRAPVSVNSFHGNLKEKNGVPFQKTRASVLQKVKSSKGPASKVFIDILEDAGGFEKVKSAGEHSRNIQQIYNARKEPQKDELSEILDLCKQQGQHNDGAFVRNVGCAPEKTVFLANDRQLKDIEKFCTNNNAFSVLGVDPTYNIGHFYVSVSTYRHLMLLTSDNVHPVMIGPVLLHFKKDFDSYFQLPSNMLRYNKRLADVQCVGTDGEVNVSDALKSVFTKANHLLCDIHFRDNVEKKMTELGIAGREKKEMLLDIFGVNKDGVQTKGLVDCWGYREVDEMFLTLKGKWCTLHDKGENFAQYFENNKLQLVKNCMNAQIRTASGLGYPPKVYTQNANECMNSVIKRQCIGRKLSLREAAQVIEGCVRQQETFARLAVIGLGKWKVAEPYADLSIPQERFYNMDARQRGLAIERFNRAPLVEEAMVDELAAAVHEENERWQCPAADSQMHTARPIPLSTLSISPIESGITFPPISIIEEMFSDAAVVLKSGNNIVEAPGASGSTHIVMNELKPTEPFVVCIKANIISCVKDRCFRYTAYRICHHILSVAEKQGKLPDFIAWYNKTNRSNMSSVAAIGHSSSAGKKATKSTQRRKGPANRKKTPVHAYDKSVIPNAGGVQNSSATMAGAATGCQAAAKSPTASMPDPMPGTYVITLLKFCHGKTSKCFGCGGSLKDKNGDIRPAPQDLVVVCKGIREYRNELGIIQEGSLGNVYFHFNTDCIKRKNKFFIPVLAQVQLDVTIHLLDCHKVLLRQGGIQF
eukprot:Seg2265.2 transcript_id=Seg2265.2/GoldUCD/mRNA.D3Y31 product="hypothetical protein" protein_id=Seg2265.2/GoldUCD/D3Y31